MVVAQDAGHLPRTVPQQPEIHESGLSVQPFWLASLKYVEAMLPGQHGSVDDALIAQGIGVNGAVHGLPPEPGSLGAQIAPHAGGQGLRSESGTSLVVIELDILGEELSKRRGVAGVVGLPETALPGEDRRGRILIGLGLGLEPRATQEQDSDGRAGAPVSTHDHFLR
jgi:hypothetical protein